MNNQAILVRAKIRLLPTSEGGKASPVHGGHSYRPNHNFALGNGDMTNGSIDLPSGQDLLPGEEADVLIEFLYWPGLDGQIYPGREWLIQEGAKVVGIGTVLEVAV